MKWSTENNPASFVAGFGPGHEWLLSISILRQSNQAKQHEAQAPQQERQQEELETGNSKGQTPGERARETHII